jgi:hypothetical protein
VQAVGREFAAGYGAAEHADAEGLRGWKTSEDDPKKMWADVSERVDEIGFCEVTKAFAPVSGYSRFAIV